MLYSKTPLWRRIISGQMKTNCQLVKYPNITTQQAIQLYTTIEAIGNQFKKDNEVQLTKCSFQIVNRADEVWSTDCGGNIGITSSRFKYCPYCSKEIEWKET